MAYLIVLIFAIAVVSYLKFVKKGISVQSIHEAWNNENKLFQKIKIPIVLIVALCLLYINIFIGLTLIAIVPIISYLYTKGKEQKDIKTANQVSSLSLGEATMIMNKIFTDFPMIAEYHLESPIGWNVDDVDQGVLHITDQLDENNNETFGTYLSHIETFYYMLHREGFVKKISNTSSFPQQIVSFIDKYAHELNIIFEYFHHEKNHDKALVLQLVDGTSYILLDHEIIDALS